MATGHLFTSESVSMGHPDKIADSISDAILDEMLKQDPMSRVAVETLVATGMAVIAGEVTTKAYVEIPDVVRSTIAEIGYTDASMRFSSDSCAVMVTLNRQSPDIARGVDAEGAGDQGMMFGFACRETPELMPLPIEMAHKLMAKQAEVRRSGAIPGLRPDAKGQVTIEYDGLTPKRVRTLVLSTQHDPSWNTKQQELRERAVEQIIRPVLGEWWSDDIRIHFNPTGRFEIGGPHGDCGLTGRKVIVDTYGGRGRHGGGAFSGKDATKVDRSAAYMARHIAKNIVAADLAEVCEVQLSYAIGVAEPTSVWIDCAGTERADPAKISDAVRDLFCLTPRGIIEALGLRKPIFRPTAAHGHFGRKPEGDFFTWERTDKAAELRRLLR